MNIMTNRGLGRRWQSVGFGFLDPHRPARYSGYIREVSCGECGKWWVKSENSEPQEAKTGEVHFTKYCIVQQLKPRQKNCCVPVSSAEKK